MCQAYNSVEFLNLTYNFPALISSQEVRPFSERKKNKTSFTSQLEAPLIRESNSIQLIESKRVYTPAIFFHVAPEKKPLEKVGFPFGKCRFFFRFDLRFSGE